MLGDLLTTCTARGWTIDSTAVPGRRADAVATESPADRLVTVGLRLSKLGTGAAAQ
ncbi:hypothetical protein ACFYU5_34260 [Nocardia aobensis]|uniref:Uncharacterized protein n=1 Tax=Nocardia aobensis TaxID=257277 RepID=A0ABW6PEI8_9NOCA